MTERQEVPLLDHEYDGIREYDNPCPTWWHAIFLGSVVFSVLYFVFFHIAPSAGTNGWTLDEAYENSVADNLQLQFRDLGDLQVDEPTVLKYMRETEWLAMGASVYKTHCKSCHGPNLTDDQYKNVKQLIDVARVIENGAANGSMPAWKNRLHPNEVVMVSAYVAKMRGQNLSGPRGSEGSAIPAWPKELGQKIDGKKIGEKASAIKQHVSATNFSAKNSWSSRFFVGPGHL
ncbi:MAG: c-type cytochrome [Pirellulaceae bacterium]|nr:c-type cytochrome [Pirellulaceae bacterium]